MQNTDLTPAVDNEKYCDNPAHHNSAECALLIQYMRERGQKVANNIRARLSKRGRGGRGGRGKREIASLKPTSAIHLTNITSLVPDISEDVHAISQRSIIYDPISEHTLSALSYASPWAAVTSYSPRHAILQTRSSIANVSGASLGMKYRILCCILTYHI